MKPSPEQIEAARAGPMTNADTLRALAQRAKDVLAPWASSALIYIHDEPIMEVQDLRAFLELCLSNYLPISSDDE